MESKDEGIEDEGTDSEMNNIQKDSLDLISTKHAMLPRNLLCCPVEHSDGSHSR